MRLVAIVVLCAGRAAVGEGPWEAAGDDGGTRLAVRDRADLGDVLELRATAEVDGTADEVFAVVADYARYPEFLPGLLVADVLEGAGTGDQVVYMRYEPSFLVIDARDVVLRVRIDAAGAGGRRSSAWTVEPGRLPEVADTVRMPLNSGSWVIDPLEGGRCRVTYTVAVDPGGSLPGWIVRWGAKRALPDVIETVRTRVVAVRAARGGASGR